VNLEDLWFAGKLDSGVGQYGHQPLTERLELLPRVPDFAAACRLLRFYARAPCARAGVVSVWSGALEAFIERRR